MISEYFVAVPAVSVAPVYEGYLAVACGSCPAAVGVDETPLVGVGIAIQIGTFSS